jgi:hypothetical protein
MKEYLGNSNEICDFSTFNVKFSMSIALLLIMKFDISVYNGFMWLNITDKKR